MTDYHDSWKFLIDFYKSDRSIAGLINQALSEKSIVNVSNESIDSMLEDILSVLPNDYDKRHKSYLDFLRYVTPKYCQKDIVILDKEEIDVQTKENIEELENVFLNHIWINILAYSSANGYFSKEIRQSSIPAEYIPYLILYSLDITRKWFLYGGASASSFVDEKKDFEVLHKKLRDGYKSWRHPLRFYSKLPNIISKLFYKKQLSSEQLFPLMTLLIVLKREWKYSRSQEYINYKFNSLKKLYPTNIISHALIYGLYNQFSEADETIRQKFDMSIPSIELHPLVAKNIITFKSFRILFDTDIIQPADEITIYRKNKYINTESKLEDGFCGKRLLVDYLFPQTEVRKNDVFVPSPSLTDRIYISLFKGETYNDYWRVPSENEKFDKIQIEPNTNYDGEYDDNRVIDYRDNLTPTGEFLVVKSNEDDIINNRIKEAFSDFRHDLKDLMSAASIKNLQGKLISVIKYVSIIQEVINRTHDLMSDLMSSPSNDTHLNETREAIKELDNNQELRDFVQNKDFETSICEIRAAIEEKNAETLTSVSDHLRILERVLVHVSIDNLSKCSKLTESIEESHNTLCSFIKIAGAPTIEKKDSIVICDWLNKYIRHVTMDVKRVPISLDYSEIDNGSTVIYNKAVLTVILNSIVDNAIRHGFHNYDCKTPMIKIILRGNKNYIILRICNNGRPIDITNEDYKTRGVFSGITGHTGLGGYQISKYAEILGGYVELPQEKEWNTEVHLYIKK